MKGRVLSVCWLLAFAVAAFAEGEISFQNRFIETPEGQLYRVPIWIDLNGDGTFQPGEGIGSYAAKLGQTATLALYLQGKLEPLATALFRSDTNGQFLGNPSVQTVLVPGYSAGTTAPLTIKAWVGPDYETATIRGTWDFTSQPLGGAPPGGGVPLIPPSVFGWGDPNGEGYKLTAIPLGEITFQNRFVRTPDGQLYHVPIWIDLNGDSTFEPGEGIGSYAAAFGETATLALYLQGKVQPLATALFRSDTNGEFLGNPPLQDVLIPGYAAGTTAPLTIKVWIGSDYETAAIRGAWDFTSLPLGGEPPDGSVPMIPPSVFGWGDPNGEGYRLIAPVAPIAGNDAMTRRSLGDARIPIEMLLANDSDPNGGAVIFVGVDSHSNAGAALTRLDGDIVYHPINAAPDSFYYSVRNSAGGLSRARVDVTIVDPDGMIILSNRSIPLANGNGTYNVPIFVDANFDGKASAGEAIGTFASVVYHQPAKLGLYLKGSDVPLATASFRVDSLATFVNTAQAVVIPGAPPGSRVDLTVKAWIGNDFATAKVKGAWDFTSAPLGGFVASGPPYATPGLTGWGNENGSGYGVAPGASLIVGPDEVLRGYRQDATINIATLLANDSDPDGGALTLIGVDSSSHEGATVMISGPTITYRHNVESDDYFTYTVRSTSGAIGVGRVNVKASEPIGEIVFSNYNIPKATGGGTYDVPIYVDYNTNGAFDTGEGLGTFAALFGKTATLALYQQGSNQPIATLKFNAIGIVNPFGSDGFAAYPDTTNALVPGFRPGQQAPLTVKAWVGDDFESATVKGSWDFTSFPLGGPQPGGTNVVPVPGLTGWGDENGHGYALNGDLRPIVGPDAIHVIQGIPIRVAILLPNDSDPAGGGLTVVGVTPTSQNGNQVVLYDNNFIYLANAKVGSDSFSYSVVTSSGAVGSAHVDVTIDPCCGGTTTDTGTSTSTDPGDGTSTTTSPGGGYGTTTGNTSTSTGTGTGTSSGSTDTTGSSTGGGPISGKIYLVNQLVRHPTGHVYNVPIWVDANFNGVRDKGEGIGAFASSVLGKTATLGLFLRNSTAPFATVHFRTNVGGAFIEEPGYIETAVPGYTQGAQVDLTIKAWIGEDYASATLKGSWDFASLPLGASGNDAPDITGWGLETGGKGYAIVPGVKPRAYGAVITRQSGQNVNTTKATITQNDSDPGGGALTLASVDEVSKQGAVITVLGDTIYYVARNQDTDAPDYFEYTVRNAQGGYAKGRVDVAVTDAQGQFDTLLQINYEPTGNDISFRGVIGSNYTVQFRDTVDAVWQDLGPAMYDAFGLFKINDATGTATRFYRVVTQP